MPLYRINGGVTAAILDEKCLWNGCCLWRQSACKFTGNGGWTLTDSVCLANYIGFYEPRWSPKNLMPTPSIEIQTNIHKVLLPKFLLQEERGSPAHDIDWTFSSNNEIRKRTLILYIIFLNNIKNSMIFFCKWIL